MRWIALITTAPRQDCTLLQCIASVRAAGWEPVIFAEPGSTPTDCETIWNETRRGCWHNWYAAAKYGVASGAERIITIQDDTAFHPESRAFVDTIRWPPDAAFVSLYTPSHYQIINKRHWRPRGLNRIETRSLWGACAMAFESRVLRDMINHQIAKTWLGVPPKNVRPKESRAKRAAEPWTIANSDTAIGKIANAMRLGMYFLDPSLVSHIAEHSSIGHGDNTGRRNAARIADHSKPLAGQVFPQSLSKTSLAC